MLEESSRIGSIKFAGIENGKAKMSGVTGWFTLDTEEVARVLADAEKSAENWQGIIAKASRGGPPENHAVRWHSAWSSYASELKKASAALTPAPAGWAVAETETPQ